MTTRSPAVAGTFYPSRPEALAAAVEGCLEGADTEGPVPQALIVPHAGYVYSGPVAGTAYARLVPLRDRITRVVLLGPAHRAYLTGLALPDADALATPLGSVPVAQDAEALLTLPQVERCDAAFDGEHSLEVQLPFLQRVLGRFEVVPLLVGAASPEVVAEVIDAAWGGEETLVVVSSDLSHYLDYDAARRADDATMRAIVRLDARGLHRHSACGRAPIAGLLVSARRRELTCELLDLRSSGDTAGEKRRVVGYGAFLFH